MNDKIEDEVPNEDIAQEIINTGIFTVTVKFSK